MIPLMCGVAGSFSCAKTGGGDTPADPFAQPTDLQASDVTQTSARFTWKGNSEYYQVKYGPSANPDAAVTRPASNESFTAPNLEKNTEYTWSVRATDSKGKEFGEWAEETKFTTLAFEGTHEFHAGVFLFFPGTDALRNYFIRLYPKDIRNGEWLELHFFASGPSELILPDGTYTVGGEEPGEISTIDSSLATFVDNNPISDIPLKSGTVKSTFGGYVADGVASIYTLVIDVTTETGVNVKTTYAGVTNIMQGALD